MHTEQWSPNRQVIHPINTKSVGHPGTSQHKARRQIWVSMAEIRFTIKINKNYKKKNRRRGKVKRKMIPFVLAEDFLPPPWSGVYCFQHAPPLTSPALQSLPCQPDRSLTWAAAGWEEGNTVMWALSEPLCTIQYGTGCSQSRNKQKKRLNIY